MIRASYAIAAALLLVACDAAPPNAPPSTAASARYTLTFASPYPPTHPFSRADIEWMTLVTKESGGRIVFRPYWSGALLSADMSMEEIRHGIADIGLITPIYARGGAHLLRVQSGFYGGVRDINQQVAVYDCLAARFPGFAKELEGLHVLAVQGGNFPGVLTRYRPIRTLADFKGLRLRAQSDAIDVLTQLGADPVNMPMGEVYSALAKGVIDGVVAPADTIKSLHFSEVAKHFTTIRFSRGAYPARAISDAAWRRLPPDMQALLIRSKPAWETALNRQLQAAEIAGIASGRSNGVTFRPLPSAEQARFDALYNADATRQARGMQTIDIDAEPVLAAAQAMIKAGAPRRCATTGAQETNS